MALMPRSQPFSVPDPLADAWDAMVRLNRRLQAKNDPLAGVGDPRSPSDAARRTQEGETGRAAPEVRPGAHLMDLGKPENNPHMTTCADEGCTHSFSDPYPASNLGRRYDPAAVRKGLKEIATGVRIDMGPRVTFINDIPSNPSPNQPLTTPTARMVAASILQSGAHDVNINSTTGGRHGNKSNHYKSRAVDINRVDGQKVSPRYPAQRLQDAALLQPNIAEDYGPSYLLNDKAGGRAAVRNGATIRGHRDHIHLAGDR